MTARPLCSLASYLRLIRVSEWLGDDGDSRRTLKVQVCSLANRKNYAIWLPVDALDVLIAMLQKVALRS